MTQPLLSILIPTRNRSYYLRNAIQSALNIKNTDIEILVSENYGSDDALALARSFSDERLKVFQPDHPLPMHENYEFLLSKSSGNWVTFIGDDDGIMPHAVDYLLSVQERFPEIEAICSERAYFFWPSAYGKDAESSCIFTLTNRERIKDSKNGLKKCLKGNINYFTLPQIYSGGFQRRSLINRIKYHQSGIYFRSVIPDAYSAAVSLLFTYRYLETGVPLTWVGTSPRIAQDSKQATKNIQDDLFGMHKQEHTINAALVSDEVKSFWPLTLYFYESYLSALYPSAMQSLSFRSIARIYRACARVLDREGDHRHSLVLARSLGVRPRLTSLLASKIYPLSIFICYTNRLRNLISTKFRNTFLIDASFCLKGSECPDILTANICAARLIRRHCKLFPG